MANNEVHKYNYPTSVVDIFEKHGHPGKWMAAIVVSGSGAIVEFTGSANYGAGGIVVPTGTTGTASLSGGGTVPLGAFANSAVAGTAIVELSLRSVRVDSGTVYVLLRNQKVI